MESEDSYKYRDITDRLDSIRVNFLFKMKSAVIKGVAGVASLMGCIILIPIGIVVPDLSAFLVLGLALSAIGVALTVSMGSSVSKAHELTATELRRISSKFLGEKMEFDAAIQLLREMQAYKNKVLSISTQGEKPYLLVTDEHEAFTERISFFSLKKVTTTFNSKESKPYLGQLKTKLEFASKLGLNAVEEAVVGRIKADAIEIVNLHLELVALQSKVDTSSSELLVKQNLLTLENEIQLIIEEKAKDLQSLIEAQSNYIESRQVHDSKLTLNKSP